MGYVTKTTAELFDDLLQGDVKGIANPGEWKDARPVTLRGILKDVMDQYPDIMWLVEDSGKDSGKCISAKIFVISMDRPFKETAEEEPGGAAPGGEPCANEETEAAVEPDTEPEEADGEAEPAAVEPDPEPDEANGEAEPAAVESDPEPEEADGEAEPAAVELDPGPEPAAEADNPDKVEAFAARFEECMKKWGGKALTTTEAKDIAYKMLDEGFSVSQVAIVVRRSQQTIYNWCKKRKETEISGDEAS